MPDNPHNIPRLPDGREPAPAWVRVAAGVAALAILVGVLLILRWIGGS